MLTRLIATVAALLIAGASPQASAYARVERVSLSLADLAPAERTGRGQETAAPARTVVNPKTAPPARARPAAPAPGKHAALTHCRIGENWSPLQRCASMPAVYQWDGTRLAGRTNAVGNSTADYQHAYGWPLTTREGSQRLTIHPDTHGSPQLLTDPTGAIAGWTRRDIWGVEKAQSGTQTALGHTGYVIDPLLPQELHAQARQYRPGVGRFTSTDAWAGDNQNPITLNKYLAFNGNPGAMVDPTGNHAEPGHYYTSFISAKAAGYSTQSALTIALYSQLPDEVGSMDAINQQVNTLGGFNGHYEYRMKWSMVGHPHRSGVEKVWVPNEFGRDTIHKGLHNLGGGNSEVATAKSRNILLSAESDEVAGLAAHALADSYSHRMLGNEGLRYPTGPGHLKHDTFPDMIAVRPALYREYLIDLTRTLAQRRGAPMKEEDLEAFADSMMKTIQVPITVAEQRLKQRNIEPDFARPTNAVKTIYGTAESQIAERIRRRARSVSVQESADGALLLSPEIPRVGYSEKTALAEQKQLTRFFTQAMPSDKDGEPVSVDNTIYKDDAKWPVVRSHLRTYLQLAGFCEDGSCEN